MFLPEIDVMLDNICIDFWHVFNFGTKYSWDATLRNPVPQVTLECYQVLICLALFNLRDKSGNNAAESQTELSFHRNKQQLVVV